MLNRRISGLRYEVIDVVDMRENRRFWRPDDTDYWNMRRTINPGLWAFRVFMSSPRKLEQDKRGSLSYAVFATFGEDSPVEQGSSAAFGLEEYISGPAGTPGYAGLPESLAVRRDPARHYYYTYVFAANATLLAVPCDAVWCRRYDLRVDPQTFSIQLHFLVNGLLPATSNVITVPAADIARAWQEHLKLHPSRLDDK